MTDMTIHAGPAARNRLSTQQIFWQSAIGILVLVPITLVAMIGEDRILNGINLWVKPLKFQISVALHVMTLAVLLRLVAPAALERWWLRAVVWACAISAVFEVVYITLQAGRGRHSHFNDQTVVEQALYGAMGIGAVILIGAAAVIGLLVLLRPRSGLGQGLRWGAGLGLILGFVATLIVAGYMSGIGGHWVGGSPTDAGGLPIVGWARDGGDLRVPHFFATHLMQVLPVVGWAADRWTRRPVTAVAGTAALGMVLVIATFLQALAGQPFLG